MNEEEFEILINFLEKNPMKDYKNVLMNYDRACQVYRWRKIERRSFEEISTMYIEKYDHPLNCFKNNAGFGMDIVESAEISLRH